MNSLFATSPARLAPHRDDTVDPEILSLLLSRKADPNLYGADGVSD